MLEFRPHHFLCTLGFEGKGYSEAFVRGFQSIVDLLSDEEQIRVVATTDSICGPCPNRREALCATESKIQTLDAGHASILGLRAGQQIQWGKAKQLIASKMTDEAFESACAPCSWKALGVCKAALERLRQREAQ